LVSCSGTWPLAIPADDIIAEFPDLTRDQIAACLDYARDLAEFEAVVLMALRFLADHFVSNSTVQTLREAKYEVFRLKDVLPVESSDAIVLAKARRSMRSGFLWTATSPVTHRAKGAPPLTFA